MRLSKDEAEYLDSLLGGAGEAIEGILGGIASAPDRTVRATVQNEIMRTTALHLVAPSLQFSVDQLVAERDQMLGEMAADAVISERQRGLLDGVELSIEIMQGALDIIQRIKEREV